MADADPFPIQHPPLVAADAAELRKARAKRMRMIFMAPGPLLAIGAGLWYWFSHPGEVETDNAYVKQDLISVASEVTGMITEVSVRENRHVRAGDVLFTIDPAQFRVAAKQADAQIAAAQARVTALQAEVDANAADLAGARDDLVLAQSNYARAQALMNRGFNTRANMDAAEYAVASARDRLASLQAEVEKARAQLARGAQVPGTNPAIAAAQAASAKALLDLHRTVVRAPADGVVTQVSRLQVGQMAFPGVGMVTIMRGGSTRLEANFKETDLDRMRPGQKADIRIDAYPDLKLSGYVDSIGAGTGSEFSVLPPQNATGNWVKVIQRVPVRIALGSPSRKLLIAGLSANVTVHVGN